MDDQILRLIKEYTAYYRNQNSYYYITEENGRLIAFTMPQSYIDAVAQIELGLIVIGLDMFHFIN